jgi:hypothetical protein
MQCHTWGTLYPWDARKDLMYVSLRLLPVVPSVDLTNVSDRLLMA